MPFSKNESDGCAGADRAGVVASDPAPDPNQPAPCSYATLRNAEIGRLVIKARELRHKLIWYNESNRRSIAARRARAAIAAQLDEIEGKLFGAMQLPLFREHDHVDRNK